MRKIFLILIFLSGLVFAEKIKYELDKETMKTIRSKCGFNSFIFSNKIVIGVGNIFNDTTTKRTACIVKYNTKTNKIIYEKSFKNMDIFYKIIRYKNELFLLGAKSFQDEYNIGRAYSDKGFIGYLIKLDSDSGIIKQERKIDINGFGNVKDFQISNDKLNVLYIIKKSTSYDNEIYADILINTYDTNFTYLKNLQLKTKDYLANDLYIDKNSFIITDKFNNKLCKFGYKGYKQECYINNNRNDNNINEIFNIEDMKKTLYDKYNISTFNSTFTYAIKKEFKYILQTNKQINNQYLYKIDYLRNLLKD
ncbi:hypothetical protein Arnit_2151 [Arcobacter nitrofigilis DSM 7299]|uniref:Uncharacterized protein n=1 Tax=Arcobacter nitrofigilis (strain ATCC 33309 / DSM 7299 / CCUG 15893 / LMG 7604 / NCTC 12251 / CI) TaxID=572480 RepID=D5V0J2_ARCNC|nr:hypothetical protein [Arcobacter nitrofigilis]ADG93804.1 hypothetical protein Arnit_2151 [Arcobacter nitrofigilis DSM 7299]